MLFEIYYNIYTANLWMAAVVVLAMIVVWALLNALFPKQMRIVSMVMVGLSVLIILTLTIFFRPDADVISELTPFALLCKSITDPAIFRSVVMNIFLFVPLGMSLPFVIRSTALRRVLFTILAGFLLSGAIELLQHFLLVGMMQTDDVICNTLGTAVGACAYPLSLLWQKLMRKNDKE